MDGPRENIMLSEVSHMKVKVKSLSHVRLFATPWTGAYQASLLMGFSRQEYWSGLPFPSPGDLPNPGMEPGSPTLEADAFTSEPPNTNHILLFTIPAGVQSPPDFFISVITFVKNYLNETPLLK